MRLPHSFLLGVFFLLISVHCVFAQDQGGLKDVEIGADVDWNPSLSDGNKMSDTPKPDTTATKTQELTYSVTPVKLQTSFELTPIKAVRIKDENIVKFYKNYVKLGFGNYTTPYAELFTNNLRSKEYSLGAHLKHHSSSGQINKVGPSGFSDNLVTIYGERYLPNYSVGADVNYTRNAVHFYGYDAEKISKKKNDIRQRFNYFNAGVELNSRYMEKFKVHHTVKLKYGQVSDMYSGTENDIFLEAKATKLYDFYGISVAADENFIAFENPLKQINRNIANITPTVEVKDWGLNGGLRVSIETDAASNIYHFYPVADFSYTIVEKILLFKANYGGSIQKNSFKTFSLENPFIDTLKNYKNTNIKLDVSGELKAFLGLNSTMSLAASYKEMDNMALYVNKATSTDKFDVIYDNSQYFNLHAEFSHQRSEKVRLVLKGDYLKYTMENEQKAWNKPQYQFALSTFYNMQNKIVLKADIFALGERFARGIDTANKTFAIPLNAIVDANVGIEYRFTKLMSFYLNINNIGAVRYFQWHNYPAQRFNVLGGLTYSF